MRSHRCQYKAAKRHYDHRHDLRRDLPEEFLQINERKRGKDRRDYLRLVSDHIHLEESEIPFRDIRRRCTGY